MLAGWLAWAGLVPGRAAGSGQAGPAVLPNGPASPAACLPLRHRLAPAVPALHHPGLVLLPVAFRRRWATPTLMTLTDSHPGPPGAPFPSSLSSILTTILARPQFLTRFFKSLQTFVFISFCFVHHHDHAFPMHACTSRHSSLSYVSLSNNTT